MLGTTLSGYSVGAYVLVGGLGLMPLEPHPKSGTT